MDSKIRVVLKTKTVMGARPRLATRGRKTQDHDGVIMKWFRWRTGQASQWANDGAERHW